eukprot:4948923-Amphidinium_carterae.1
MVVEKAPKLRTRYVNGAGQHDPKCVKDVADGAVHDTPKRAQQIQRVWDGWVHGNDLLGCVGRTSHTASCRNCRHRG